MPRRLGDDPLARAKNAKADPSQASAPSTGTASGQSLRRQSYNDVFFERRADAGQQEVAASPQPQHIEAAEISEISEIPQMREAAAAPTVQPTEAAAIVTPEASVAQNEVVVAVSPSRQVAEPAGYIETIVAQVQAQPAPTPQPAGATADGHKAEPQKSGGFFKRLFGRFGQ